MKKLTIIFYGFNKAAILTAGVLIIIMASNNWEFLIGFFILVLREIYIEWVHTLPVGVGSLEEEAV